MEFTADQVWGLAVRADVQNDGYIKEALWTQPENDLTGPMVLVKEANKVLVKQWLRDNVQPTEQEIAQGQEYRKFFAGYTLKAMMGQLNDFDKTALRIAQMDTFTGRNMLEFAVVSCLPATVRREQARTDIKREIFGSEQLNSKEGEVVVGDIEVVSSRFNVNYNKFKIQARMGEAFVDFWFNKALQGTARIKGKVKFHRGDKTTALNYVKIVG